MTPKREEAALMAAPRDGFGGKSERIIASDTAGLQRVGVDGAPAQALAGEPEAAAGDGRGTVADAVRLPGFLESSLVRNRPRCDGTSAPVSGGDICYLEEPSAATRSDGGILSEFIYAVPRFRPTPPAPESRLGYSAALSPKAARTIQAAAEIAYQDGKPFRAMWVFSIRDEFLDEFLPPDGYDGKGRPARTLSSELRRFFNRFSAYCRTHGLPEVDYAWAAESESSGKRRYHPHAHCLVTIAVRRAQFADLSEAVERIWGLGSVNMTILRIPRNAAAYCLKGVGYTVKGTDGTQGRVWGRRFGLSRHLRHTEIRTSHAASGSTAFAIVDVANTLRFLGLPAVRTPYGCFTPRGFYPEHGATWAQVPIAAVLARAQLREVKSGGYVSMDSDITF